MAIRQADPEVQRIISALALEHHPEGGWFRETYRAAATIPAATLPPGFGGARAFSTAIYFLLAKGEFSALHRIKSDELWHFYAGTSLTVQVLTPAGEHRPLRLGPDLGGGESFQATVAAGSWFGAELSGPGEYALLGCTVAPGFDFGDFEMGRRDRLLADYPAHHRLIKRLTRAGGPGDQ